MILKKGNQFENQFASLTTSKDGPVYYESKLNLPDTSLWETCILQNNWIL